MVTICDAPRCGDRALTRWVWAPDDQPDADLSELTFCGHCSDERADALVTSTWVQVEDDRVDEVAPA